MPKTMKKKTVAAKKPAKKSAPKMAKAKKPSNVISFTELFELKKKRMAEAEQQRQQGWKDGTNGPSHEGPKEKFQVNTRAGRTGGMGSRHH